MLKLTSFLSTLPPLSLETINDSTNCQVEIDGLLSPTRGRTDKKASKGSRNRLTVLIDDEKAESIMNVAVTTVNVN